MTRLSTATLATVAPEVARPAYERAALKPGIVHLLADDGDAADQRLPSRKDIGRLQKERESILKGRRLHFRIDRGQTEPIGGDGTRGDVSELDEDLRREVQNLTLPVKLEHGMSSDSVLCVGYVCQPRQDGGIE